MAASAQLLIFDLDGTLVDSQGDLAASVNAMLHHFGFGPLPEHAIVKFIGDGAQALVSRAVLAAANGIEPGIPSDDALQFFMAHYRQHLLDRTRAYAGVLEALQSLRESNPQRLMAVLTNKPVVPSRRICEGLHLAPLLFAIHGGNSFGTKKPHPEGLAHIRREAESRLGHPLASEQVWMIGDSATDVLTAKNAGVMSLGCTWGYAKGSMLASSPDLIAHSPADWPPLLGT